MSSLSLLCFAMLCDDLLYSTLPCFALLYDSLLYLIVLCLTQLDMTYIAYFTFLYSSLLSFTLLDSALHDLHCRPSLGGFFAWSEKRPSFGCFAWSQSQATPSRVFAGRTHPKTQGMLRPPLAGGSGGAAAPPAVA